MPIPPSKNPWIGVARGGPSLVPPASRTRAAQDQYRRSPAPQQQSSSRRFECQLGDTREGSGVTVNVYRPGRVGTEMQAWIRGQDPEAAGGGLVEVFKTAHATGQLITPQRSADGLAGRVGSDETGRIWDVAGAVV